MRWFAKAIAQATGFLCTLIAAFGVLTLFLRPISQTQFWGEEAPILIIAALAAILAYNLPGVSTYHRRKTIMVDGFPRES